MIKSKPAMHRIKTKAIYQEVTVQIREMIRDGIFTKGQKIDEKYLCESMGVSRTPIRESLRMLNAEGLIQLIPNKGAYVSDLPVEVIQDLFEVMSVLEGTCARLAAQKMTDRDFSKIELLHQELEHHYSVRDHKAYLQRNHILHKIIQEVTGNMVLKEVIDGLWQKVLLYRHKQLYQGDRFDQSIQEHRDLLKAFRKRDAALAENTMKQHLMNQCNALINGLMLEQEEQGSKPES